MKGIFIEPRAWTFRLKRAGKKTSVVAEESPLDSVTVLKKAVNRPPGSAHETRACRTPCSMQVILGTSPWIIVAKPQTTMSPAASPMIVY